MISIRTAAVALTALAMSAGAAHAQVPPDIAAKIKAIGPKIDVSVGALYAPLHAKEPYAGVTVTRDLAYGSDPLQKLDVFSPQAKPAKLKPVLLFVHGGGFVRGDKKTTDNMVVWGVGNGLVGVDINYRLAPKDPWARPSPGRGPTSPNTAAIRTTSSSGAIRRAPTTWRIISRTRRCRAPR